jgi:hypothetical protein
MKASLPQLTLIQRSMLDRMRSRKEHPDYNHSTTTRRTFRGSFPQRCWCKCRGREKRVTATDDNIFGDTVMGPEMGPIMVGLSIITLHGIWPNSHGLWVLN